MRKFLEKQKSQPIARLALCAAWRARRVSGQHWNIEGDVPAQAPRHTLPGVSCYLTAHGETISTEHCCLTIPICSHKIQWSKAQIGIWWHTCSLCHLDRQAVIVEVMPLIIDVSFPVHLKVLGQFCLMSQLPTEAARSRSSQFSPRVRCFKRANNAPNRSLSTKRNSRR